MNKNFALMLLAGTAMSLVTAIMSKPGVATSGAAFCDISSGTPTLTLNQQPWLQADSKYFQSGQDAINQCRNAANLLQAAQNNNQAKYLAVEGRTICLRGDRKSGCQGGPENGIYKLFEVKAGQNGQLVLLDMLDRKPDPKDVHRTLGIMYIPIDQNWDSL